MPTSPLSTTQNFTVIVQDYIHISIGSTVVATNSAGVVPLAVYASTPSRTSLQFTLDYPPDLLTNVFISSTNSSVGVATATPVGAGQILITLTAPAWGNHQSA